MESEETQYSKKSIKTEEKGNLGNLIYPIPTHSEPQGPCKKDSPIEPPAHHIQRMLGRRAALITHMLTDIPGHVQIRGKEY